ncbi:restriction endonuclease [Streptomyces sp. NPDC005426]|uniref:restriction endonuclease n=1 Tax=Streptomyces sp. NPDC005426 TaxID=3155344 RepID=UPI0033B9270F
MPPRAVPPQPMQISSWQQAELNAARWMRHWGYADATARPGGPDSGIDVRAAGALGQVKYQAASVGRPELQRFVGARSRGSSAQLIFFTGSDYAATAVSYAQEWGIALFTYRLDGAMTPVNDAARRIHRSPAPAVAPPASPAARNPAPAASRSFWDRNWRVFAGAALLMAPLRSIGDEKMYTGPLAVDVLKFIGILLACWALGAFLIAARFGARLSLGTRPLRVVVSRPGADSATAAGPTRVPRPPRDRAPAPSPARQDGLVAEAAGLLRTGSKPHHVDKILKDRGVGFMERGSVINEAKKLNKTP